MGSWMAPRTLRFSVRSDSASKLTGSSIAVRASSCSRWFCSTSRAAPVLLVEGGPAPDADVLGHRDLHGVDVVGVPDRLEQRVGEAQREQVLDRLLAQVVVDPEDVPGGEHVVDEPVQRLRRGEVVAERLLHDDASPALRLVVVGHPRALHLLQHRGEGRRWDREVERGVATRAVAGVEVDERLRRACRRRRRRRRSRAGTWSPPRAAATPPRGTRCGAPCEPPPWRSARSRRHPSRAGRSRAARSPAAAARGWRGRRRPGSASCGPGRRSRRRRPGRTAPVPAGAVGRADRAAGCCAGSSRECFSDLGEPGGVLDVQTQHRPAVLGEHLGVAGGLGRDQGAERERPVGDRHVGGDEPGDLQERPDRRAALVELPGRVQEAGSPAEGDRPAGTTRKGVPDLSKVRVPSRSR